MQVDLTAHVTAFNGPVLLRQLPLAVGRMLGDVMAMLRFAMIAGLVLLCAGSVRAENFTLCFERDYDAAHMKQHKLQEVTRIRLRLKDDLTGDVAAGFRALNAYQVSDVECAMRGKEIACRISDQGGSFIYQLRSDSIMLTNTSYMRFGPDDSGISIQREAEHAKFKLYPVACD
jgi:hypothetical protein